MTTLEHPIAENSQDNEAEAKLCTLCGESVPVEAFDKHLQEDCAVAKMLRQKPPGSY